MPLFRKIAPPFSLKTLQKDSNCIAIQDPSAVWGAQDFLPRRNLLLATDTLATQNVTVVATAYKLYMQGTGSITLSGTGSGTLNGTGANDRVSLSFTPTAGTCTFTVSGTVTYGMLCRADTIDQSYQKITDWTTEQYAWAAQKQVPWLRRNRFLNTATLSTQTVSSVTATPLTVSFKGTGTITFSTAYVGSLVGTGANDRVTATFTPSAGNLVCTVSGTVTEAQCEVAGAATEYQPILASWDATYTANAIAAGYPISLWHDAAGTIAAWESGRAIGACRDQKYEGYGPNLVTNGTFDSDTTGWALNGAATISWDAASCVQVDITGSSGGIQYSGGVTTTSGKSYLLRFYVKAGTYAGNILAYLAGSISAVNVTVNSTWQQVSAVFTALSSNTTLTLIRNTAATGTVYFDNISVREIPGYTAIQSTTLNQPIWYLDANGKPYIYRDLSNDALPITLPNLGSNCVIYTGEGNVTLKDSGITLNGSYAPITPAYDYGRIIMAGESKYDAKILKYLDQKRGRGPYALGPELVTNGGFDSDTWWVKASGVTISGGVANFSSVTAGGVSKANLLTGLKTYQIIYTVTSLSSGAFKAYIGGVYGIVRSATGTYSELITIPTAGEANCYVVVSGTTTGAIDNVSVREVILP